MMSRGTKVRGVSRLWRWDKHQGRGKKLTEKSEGEPLARSGKAILPPPKEVESERDMDSAEPVLGIMISPLAFLGIQDHQSKKH